MKEPLLFDQIGGDKLRAVLTDFYERVFADVMIGFMFQGKDKQLLIEREWQLAANLLGAPGVAYTGRPMRAAHAQQTIFGGQFERRLQLLRDAMAAHGVDPAVQQALVAHTLALRAQVTRDKGGECTSSAASEPPAPPPAPSPARLVKLGRRG